VFTVKSLKLPSSPRLKARYFCRAKGDNKDWLKNHATHYSLSWRLCVRPTPQPARQRHQLDGFSAGTLLT